MKKLLSATSLALVLGLSGNAFAQQAPATGGFQGPGIEMVTIVEALKLPDDAPVKLSGKIQKSLGDEKYLFKDATGTIIIEIDDEEWNGVNATPETEIVIVGELDKGMLEETEVDVETVTLK